ncbi:phosphotransferase [candidate division WWE3 bacterium]|nr:phosphotransferase [candidate division WWE3 bacterium]
MIINLLNKKSKKDEYLFKKEYHQRLEQILKEKYSIETKFSENFSWGYTSTSTYIKDTKDQEFVARISANTPLKEAATFKDLAITQQIADKIATRTYIPNNKGNHLTYIDQERDSQGNTLIENAILTCYPYIHGTPPFKMTEDIITQAVDRLKMIHKLDPTPIQKALETYSLEEALTADLGKIAAVVEGVEGADSAEINKVAFLHGDMTPSNILVSYEKIVAVVDFELAVVGPVEWDLARLAVFSWFRLPENYDFGTVLDLIEKTYKEDLKRDFLEAFSLEHAKSHAENIESHKDLHKSKRDYRAQLKFAKKKLKQLKKSL